MYLIAHIFRKTDVYIVRIYIYILVGRMPNSQQCIDTAEREENELLVSRRVIQTIHVL